MSSITDAARAALTVERQARQTDARTRLTVLLGTRVPATALTVADVTEDLVVFTDGTVRLAVRQDGVHLVSGVPGEWTLVAGPLADLAALGRALA